jgi:fido (protein-threonine AMPylation protein)
MQSKIDASERAVTEDLLHDFAVNELVTVDQVYKLSWIRFSSIEANQEVCNHLGEILKTYPENIPLLINSFMYDGLFTFAGRYRQGTDPNGGRVYFGPQHAHQREPKLHGVTPEKIPEKVSKALTFITRNKTSDPLMRSIGFYQKFVHVHPFYDGNGRIARLIANVYLSQHKLSIAWSEFDSKKKFIKKLNRCHLKPETDSFKILYDYIYPFRIDLETLDS